MASTTTKLKKKYLVTAVILYVVVIVRGSVFREWKQDSVIAATASDSLILHLVRQNKKKNCATVSQNNCLSKSVLQQVDEKLYLFIPLQVM